MRDPQKLYGRAFIGGAIESDVLVTIDRGVIASTGRAAHPPVDAETFDGVLVPGFIDVHVHGGDGGDFMDADDETNERILTFHARRGTTALAATTLSAPQGDLLAAVREIAHTGRRRPRGAEICGLHLEGPYISPERAGAQNRNAIRPAHIDELAALLAEAPQLRWIVTVAPEVEGVTALIRHFRDRILFSIGHTSGAYADASAALAEGARHFTHLFNAMTPLQHREPGTIGAAMSSIEATAELIADGIHVHPIVLRIATQSMPGRITLITDAMRACGLPDGNYTLLDYDVTVSDGAARLQDGTLAGSVLTMDRAVKNMVELAGLPIESVLPLATSTPARILGIQDRKGSIAEGFDADLTIIDEQLTATRTWVRGAELA